MFQEALTSNNTYRMAEVFGLLCDEIGIPDPTRDQGQAESGREIAEFLNSRGKGPEAKKI